MSIKITTESFKKYIYDTYKDEYTLLGEYEGTHKKILMKHNICGHEYYVSPNKFRSGRKCPKCANKIRASKLKKTKIDLQKELNEHYGKEEYTILSDEIGTNTEPIKVRHNCDYCGNNIFETTPNYLKQWKGCSVCGGNFNITAFKHEFYKKFGTDQFEILDNEYNGYDSKLNIKCKKCGYINKLTPRWLMQASTKVCLCKSCEPCSSSEKLIENYLLEHNIKYERNISLPGCKNKIPLRFDFKIYIDGYYILLEYDGIQHFNSIDYWDGDKGLDERILRDNLKNSFCDENNIKLYRISYNEELISSLEKILLGSL